MLNEVCQAIGASLNTMQPGCTVYYTAQDSQRTPPYFTVITAGWAEKRKLQGWSYIAVPVQVTYAINTNQETYWTDTTEIFDAYSNWHTIRLEGHDVKLADKIYSFDSIENRVHCQFSLELKQQFKTADSLIGSADLEGGIKQ